MAPIGVLLTILAVSAVVAQEDLTTTEATKRAVNAGLRIIRGRNAQLGQFPWQTRVECIRRNFLVTGCGGSLITDRHILTAAHCVKSIVLCQVSLGMINLTNKGYSYFLRTSDIVVHENYKPNGYVNDIAIIRLNSPIKLTENIQPIRLAKESQSTSTLCGVSAVISGWGRTRDSQNGFYNFLQYAKVRIMPQNECNKFYMKNFDFPIADGQLCTDFSSSNVCNGDSGGPLSILEADNNWTLIGIVSLGISPCEEGLPSVFTAVAYYLPWIYQNTQN